MQRAWDGLHRAQCRNPHQYTQESRQVCLPSSVCRTQLLLTHKKDRYSVSEFIYFFILGTYSKMWLQLYVHASINVERLLNFDLFSKMVSLFCRKKRNRSHYVIPIIVRKNSWRQEHLNILINIVHYNFTKIFKFILKPTNLNLHLYSCFSLYSGNLSILHFGR